MIARFILCCLLAAGLRAADFPAPYNSEKTPGTPMPPEEAARAFKLPPGFKATVFAAEPDVQNPIACAWDARGRLWIAENYTYAERPVRFDTALRDRILIFEDADGDGHFDKRTVFTDELQTLTSIELGFGGVYALCPPQLLFIPMKDDAPSGPPQVLLDGFTVAQENYHNLANGLRWGPDGWLYGRVGASCAGKVGAPGTPDAERVPIAGGIWRYHPQRKVFEMLCHGTTNPWGLDWNEHGEGFFTNTVNGHLWHLIPGAHFDRPHTIDPNPHVYQLMQQCADHYHFDTGKGWTESRDGKADAFGGGHAHCGAMVYLGDNWPDEYRGKLYTLNFHGRRINIDRLEREGSGYVGRHDGDMAFAADPWFRGIDLTYGPDGGVYILDWSDAGECHESTGVHRTSGRIYKITYGEPKRVEPFDLSKISNEELVKLHEHRNEWFARMGRRVLLERFAEGQSMADAISALDRICKTPHDLSVCLRAYQTEVCMTSEPLLMAQMIPSYTFPDEHIWACAVRMSVDRGRLDFVTGCRPPGNEPSELDPFWVGKGNDGFGYLRRFLRQAASGEVNRPDVETSELVSLTALSAAMRLPLNQRNAVLEEIVWRWDLAADRQFSLLAWYADLPMIDGESSRHGPLTSGLPKLQQMLARRFASLIETQPELLDSTLSLSDKADASLQSAILTGMTEAFTGWRKAPKPVAWDEFVSKVSVTNDPVIIEKVRGLKALFGDGRALHEIKELALDGKGELAARQKALETLIAERPPELREICEKLLGVRFLNTTAARGLAQFDDPAIGENLAKNYRTFHPSERPAILDTLASRPTFARALLTAMAAGAIPRGDLTAFHARQIRGFGDAALTQQLGAAWGELRDSAEDKRALIAKLKSQLTPEGLTKADPSAGRVVFNTTCAVCHTLYGHGGQIGPDLTGANRDNLDYLLENIVDPGAVVSADFRMTVAMLKDGRVLNGIATARTDRTLTLRTITGPQTVERGDIQAEEQLPQSLMPEGLLLTLSETQVRDLFGYLTSRAQVSLP
jgi:putative membrane-bound dehydrogenase-like protein